MGRERHVGVRCVTFGHVGGEVPEFTICVKVSSVGYCVGCMQDQQCVFLMLPNFFANASVASAVGGTPDTKQKPNMSYESNIGHSNRREKVRSQRTILVSHFHKVCSSFMTCSYSTVGGSCTIFAPQRTFSLLFDEVFWSLLGTGGS